MVEVSSMTLEKIKNTKTQPINLIWVRGAGELGSAVALSLYRTGFQVFLSEIKHPLAIRRTVTFSDTIIAGQTEVETISAHYYHHNTVPETWPQDHIPLFEDDPSTLSSLTPAVLVDARMYKQYDQDYRPWAPLVIGLGPGFVAGDNCHAAVETMRGHDLGRIIWKGPTQANTGIPGNIQGESIRRVVRAPCEGTLEWRVNFGDVINQGQTLGTVNGTVKIQAPLAGLVRGLIHPQVPLQPGLKIADIDPRGAGVDYHRLSDKAQAVGRAVLETILIFQSSRETHRLKAGS
jgi:xanthine dehydrogenase accessory factor